MCWGGRTLDGKQRSLNSCPSLRLLIKLVYKGFNLLGEWGTNAFLCPWGIWPLPSYSHISSAIPPWASSATVLSAPRTGWVLSHPQPLCLLLPLSGSSFTTPLAVISSIALSIVFSEMVPFPFLLPEEWGDFFSYFHHEELVGCWR